MDLVQNAFVAAAVQSACCSSYGRHRPRRLPATFAVAANSLIAITPPKCVLAHAPFAPSEDDGAITRVTGP